MCFLGSVICFMGGGISYLRKGRFCSPIVMFALFWAILLFLSGLELYGIYPSSTFSVSLITIGTLSFIIGGSLSNAHITNYKYELNKRLYKIAVFVCLLSLYLNISFIAAFVSSGFDIHSIYSVMANMVDGDDTELLHLYDPKLVILQQFIGYPLLYILVPISIVEYITKKEKSYLIIAILLSLIRFLFDFRRTYIVIIVVFILFVLIIRKIRNRKNSPQFNNLSFGKKLFIACIVLSLVAGFILLSSSRRGDDGDEYSLVSNFYYYYVGSIPYFSGRLDSIQQLEYTFGLTSFRGVFSPVFAFFELLGFDKPYLMEIANQNVNSLHNTVMLISKDQLFNSYATCFLEFYLDGGIIGVVVISLLFGHYAESLYLNVRTNNSNRYITKYALFVSIFLFMSVLHFNGVVVCYIWPFFLERFFYKRTNILIRNQ